MTNLMPTLILAEHNGSKLDDATARAVTAANQLGQPVHVLVAGLNVDAIAKQAAQLQGVDKVLCVDHARYTHALAEPLADLMHNLSEGYSTFAAAATSQGKNVMPRLAALLDVMQVSDITKIIEPDTFERPIYAGNAIQTVRTKDAKRVLTFRSSVFASASMTNEASIEAIAGPETHLVTQFKHEELSKSERPELSAAKIVISGGRALGSADNFKKYLEPLADRLGAAIGASRAAVDAGFAPNDWQVGQTGKVVAPDLYIAIGISGAIQHLAGMKESKVIVAINKDGDAPIFQMADYGLVGDLFTLLPELQDALNKTA